MKKSIFIRDKSGKKQNYKIFHWIDYIEYKNGEITFRLSESLKPYLLGLNELFTRYEYEAVISLPTNNAIRLYELLGSYQNTIYRPKTNSSSILGIKLEKNEFLFTIDWLREYFNCKDKYPHTSDFIRRIIEPSIQAINKYTLMRAEYRVIKEKKSIKSVIFRLNNWADDPIEADKMMERLLEESKSKRTYKERKNNNE